EVATAFERLQGSTYSAYHAPPLGSTHAKWAGGTWPAAQINSEFVRGRWDRKRTCTCGFGERGTLAQSVSFRLILPFFRRSLSEAVSSSLSASRGIAVKFAVEKAH